MGLLRIFVAAEAKEAYDMHRSPAHQLRSLPMQLCKAAAGKYLGEDVTVRVGFRARVGHRYHHHKHCLCRQHPKPFTGHGGFPPWLVMATTTSSVSDGGCVLRGAVSPAPNEG